jgi:hypothetical protein
VFVFAVVEVDDGVVSLVTIGEVIMEVEVVSVFAVAEVDDDVLSVSTGAIVVDVVVDVEVDGVVAESVIKLILGNCYV